MIALTSVIGNIFRQIVSDCVLDYVLTNTFFNTAFQKAFFTNINGMFKHNQLLQDVISYARKYKKTCHATFFDLKDAFDSVRYEVSDNILFRYQILDNVIDYVNSLDSSNSVSIMGPR